MPPSAARPPTAPEPRTVAIVGAGFCGTLAAVHLLGRCAPATRICLIDRTGDFGPGHAYGTRDPAHLLNVPACRMGALPGDPGHFLAWLRRQPGHQRAGDADFLPRRLYGTYLRQLLAETAAMPGPTLQLLSAQATALTDPATLTLDAGPAVSSTLAADAVILATGNVPPLPPHGIEPARLPPGTYAPDPWCPGALANLPPDAAVILLGAGLTTADAVLSLLRTGHRGTIHILSRHGLLPRPHAAAPRQPSVDELPSRLLPLLRHVRRTIGAGAPWQAVIDGIRPRVATLWRNASPADRSRFLRHLRVWWDIHRHRLPPSTAACLDGARSTGQLRIHAGHVLGAAANPDGTVRLAFRPRGATASAGLDAARLVNCTGPAANYARLPDPLIRNLLASGLARPDPLHLGLDIAPSLALVRADGTPSTHVFALGPLLRATFWEMTSVPDLRVQAERLALTLAEQLRCTPHARA